MSFLINYIPSILICEREKKQINVSIFVPSKQITTPFFCFYDEYKLQLRNELHLVLIAHQELRPFKSIKKENVNLFESTTPIIV